jgi:DNA-binding MarR family transcriptional regulator
MKKTNGRRSASVDQSAQRRGRETISDDIESAWLIERPDLDLKVACTLLRMERANLMHGARVRAISSAIGLVTGDLHVLLALRRSGRPYELRPTDLFRTLLVTSGAMTKRVARLHEAKLISRVSANDDGRSELVRLTAKGLAIADRAISDIAQTVTRVTDECQLTEHEIDVMDRAFRKLLSVKAIKLDEAGGKKITSRARARA